MTDPAIAGEPLRLPVAAGLSLHAILHAPPANTPVLGLVVHVHALADEMNKSRRMAAWQSRRMAQAGLAVLRPDLRGCGDSDGDFGDATWALWLEDVSAAVDWLRRRFPDEPLPLTLWGHRAGALLACAAASDLRHCRQVLLWQPATNGRNTLRQFLRLKSAGMRATGQDGISIDALRAQLESGTAVDVAGYRLSPGLASGLDAARLLPPHCAVDWLELNLRGTPQLSPANQAMIESWKAAHHDLRLHHVYGPAFWESAEIEDAPELIEATVRACQARLALAATA